MFLRVKPSGKYQYLQLAESFRDGDRVRQRVLATLGRLDVLRSSGQLDSLAVSAGKLTERLAVIGAHNRGEREVLETATIGPGLIFGRLWREVGLDEAVGGLLRGRRFEFDVVAAILTTVIHRLEAPGSDRAADRWRRRHDIRGSSDLELHHLYRAMAWLGEELPRDDSAGRASLAPRCVKDLVEEQLFARRRTLLTQMVVAFFDTLASSPHRPQLQSQMSASPNASPRSPSSRAATETPSSAPSVHFSNAATLIAQPDTA